MKKGIFLLAFIFFLIFLVLAQNPSNPDFEINPSALTISVIEGENQIIASFKLSNKNILQDFIFKEMSNINFFDLDRTDLTLDKYESKDLHVFLNTGNLPGVYLGEIIVMTLTKESRLPIILEIETEDSSFDGSIDISSESLSILPGESLDLDVTIHNLNFLENEVLLKYFVSSVDGNILFSEQETYNVNNQIEISKSFSIPEEAQEGNYVFYIYYMNGDSLATSASFFRIGEELDLSPTPTLSNRYLIFSGLVIFILSIFLLLINYLWKKRVKKKENKWSKKIGKIRKIKFSKINKKIGELENKKRLLNKSYNKG